MVATLICGAMSVLTSCTSDNADNPTSMPAFPLPGDTWDAATRTLTVNSNPGKSAYEGRRDIVSVVFSDAAKHTFTWQGTPAATVEMLAVGDVNLESVQIQFTID